MFNEKSIFISLLSICLIPFLFGCDSISAASSQGDSESSSSVDNYKKYSFLIDSINGGESSFYHVSNSDGTKVDATSVYPFDTSIVITYYSDTGEDTEFVTEADRCFQKYHALFDRHNYYVDSSFNLVNNVRVINDSYKTGRKIALDRDLYDSLKKSVAFSSASDGKFSIGVGNLSSLWDYYISKSIHYNDVQMDGYEADSVAQGRVIFEDPPASFIEAAVNTTPTPSELADMFSFDDETESVTLNAVDRIDSYISSHSGVIKSLKDMGIDFSRPSITLGGYGKGEAIQLFSAKYPDKIYLINSGYSSVKCVNGKPDGSGWAISVANPYYNEAVRGGVSSGSSFNQADLIYTADRNFNLSTSGYYNNYYYSLDSSGKYHLRCHIVDPSTGYSVDNYDSATDYYHAFFASASVLLDDSGYADMYTTSLMNCSSLTEAMKLIDTLNSFTGMKAIPYFIHNTKDNGKRKSICYIDSSLKGNMSMMSETFPEYADSRLNITSIQLISDVLED